MRIFDYFRDTDEPDTQTEYKIEWTETKEYAKDKVTRKLVWTGGAERDITYVEEDWMYGFYDWMDAAEEYDLQMHEEPAYSEIVERVEGFETETVEKRKTAWVTKVPPGVTKTNATREVIVD